MKLYEFVKLAALIDEILNQGAEIDDYVIDDEYETLDVVLTNGEMHVFALDRTDNNGIHRDSNS